jgi:hypothetical protein
VESNPNINYPKDISNLATFSTEEISDKNDMRSKKQPDADLVIAEISSVIDDSIALSINSSLSSVERLLILREGLLALISTLSESNNKVYDSLILLQTILRNAKDFTDVKYRVIKATSAKFVR